MKVIVTILVTVVFIACSETDDATLQRIEMLEENIDEQFKTLSNELLRLKQSQDFILSNFDDQLVQIIHELESNRDLIVEDTDEKFDRIVRRFQPVYSSANYEPWLGNWKQNTAFAGQDAPIFEDSSDVVFTFEKHGLFRISSKGDDHSELIGRGHYFVDSNEYILIAELSDSSEKGSFWVRYGSWSTLWLHEGNGDVLILTHLPTYDSFILSRY